MNVAERGGFEPPVGFKPTHAFQACALNHSAISPTWPISVHNSLPDASLGPAASSLSPQKLRGSFAAGNIEARHLSRIANEELAIRNRRMVPGLAMNRRKTSQLV